MRDRFRCSFHLDCHDGDSCLRRFQDDHWKPFPKQTWQDHGVQLRQSKWNIVDATDLLKAMLDTTLSDSRFDLRPILFTFKWSDDSQANIMSASIEFGDRIDPDFQTFAWAHHRVHPDGPRTNKFASVRSCWSDCWDAVVNDSHPFLGPSLSNAIESKTLRDGDQMFAISKGLCLGPNVHLIRHESGGVTRCRAVDVIDLRDTGPFRNHRCDHRSTRIVRMEHVVLVLTN